MRLLFYEFIKLVRQRGFWLILLCVILADIGMIQVSCKANDDTGYYQKYYQELTDETGHMDIDQAIDYLDSEQTFYQTVNDYQVSLITGEGDIDLSDEYRERYEQYADHSEYWNERVSVISELSTYYHQISSYPSYLQNISRNAELIASGPLWKLMSDSEREDILTQAQSYEKLAGLNVHRISYRGMEAYADSMVSRLLCLLLVCAIGIMILREDEGPLFELLSGTPYGHRRTGIAKIICFLAVSFLSVLSVQITDICVHAFLYGACDISAPIQCLPSFYESSLMLTVGQWLILSSIIFAFGVSMLGLLFIFLYHFFNGGILSFIVFLVFIFIEMILYTAISPSSIFVSLTYINIMRLFEGTFIGQFLCYHHLLSFRVTNQVMIILLCLMIGMISSGLYTGLYDTRISHKKRSLPSFTVKSASLFIQEGNRILQTNKGITVIIIMICISAGMFVYRYQKYEILRQTQQNIYSLYEKYEGKITEDTVQELTARMETFAGAEKNYQKAKEEYQSEKMDYDTFMMYQTDYERQMADFSVYEKLYSGLSSESQYIIYSDGYSAVFSLKSIDRDMNLCILIMTGLILLISASAYHEQEEKIYMTAYKGVFHREKMMWIHVILLGIAAASIAYFFTYLHFSLLYPMHHPDVPMGALFEAEGTLITGYLQHMSAGMYGIMLTGIRLLGVLSLCMITVTVFRLTKNRIIGLLVSFVIIFIPMFLYYNGFTFMSVISLFDLIMGNLFLQKTYSTVKFAVLIGIDIICLWLTHKSYRNL